MKRIPSRQGGADDNAAAAQRVERLLLQAHDWEPEQAVPHDLARRALQNAVSKRPMVTRRPLLLMGGALAASVAVVAAFLLRAAPLPTPLASVPPPTKAVNPVAVLPEASEPTSPAAKAQALVAATKAVRTSHPVAAIPRHVRHRRGDFVPDHRPVLIADQTARPSVPAPSVPASHPIPANAIALDDAPPTLVPVVFAEDAPDGSGTRLTPLVLAIPANANNSPVAINLSTEE